MLRLKSVLLAISQLRGSVLRQALYLVGITAVWLTGMLVFPSTWPINWIFAAVAGPLLTLGGYIAGMLWPYWRINWIVRSGALATVAAALWLWMAAAPGQAIVLTWHPLLVGSFMLLYHERHSIYRYAGYRPVKVGDPLPDFELTDSDGQSVSRSAVLSMGPALFIFYRGDW